MCNAMPTTTSATAVNRQLGLYAKAKTVRKRKDIKESDTTRRQQKPHKQTSQAKECKEGEAKRQEQKRRMQEVCTAETGRWSPTTHTSKALREHKPREREGVTSNTGEPAKGREPNRQAEGLDAPRPRRQVQ